MSKIADYCRRYGATWPILLVLAVAGLRASAAEDLGDLREQVRQLQDKNRALQEQLEEQKRIVDSLSRKVDQIDQKASSAAESSKISQLEDLTPGPLTKSLSFGKVILSGQGAVGLYGGGADSQFAKTGFVLDEAKLFVEANIFTNFYAFGEILITQREDPNENLRIGELYLEWENASQLWGQDGVLNLRAGRMYIPFGEEYQVRDAIYNPLILHSLADIWGVDEGVELYGAFHRVHYVVAVQNGGLPSLKDYDSDKAVVGRISYDPLTWLHTSASAMRTGHLDVAGDDYSAVWFGNGFFRNLGPASTTTKFHAEMAEGDVQFLWNGGNVKAAGGAVRFDDNDRTADNRRHVYYYSFEGMQGLGDRFYAAARVSQIFAPGGFPLVGDGQYGPRFYGNLSTGLWRLSLGLGYRVSRDLILKSEYSINRGTELGGLPRNREDFFGVQAAFRF